MHLLSIHSDQPEQGIFFPQPNNQHSSTAADVDEFPPSLMKLVSLILRRVSKMNNTFAPHDAACRSVWCHTGSAVPPKPLRDSRVAACSDGMKTFAIECPK